MSYEKIDKTGDKTGDRSKLGKFVIIINLILIVPVIGVIAYNYSYKNLGHSNKAAKETLNKIEAISDVKEKQQIVTDYDFVHQMSNNLIIAEDGKIRGNQDVTLENIESGIKMLSDDSVIVEGLNKWKDGDFENAVEVHNYCWRILGGEEGKAKSLLDEGVKKAKLNVVLAPYKVLSADVLTLNDGGNSVMIDIISDTSKPEELGEEVASKIKDLIGVYDINIVNGKSEITAKISN